METRLTTQDLHKDMQIVMNGTTIKSPNLIASGGTKHIFDIGDGRVLAIMRGNLDWLSKYTDAEVRLSNKVKDLKLRTISCEKIILEVNGKTDIPALIMPSFSSLAKGGIQIRDSKNSNSSCGSSMLFGNMQNIKSLEHWRKIFHHIKDEMVVYLLNHFAFSNDSFNLSIEDTTQTVTLASQQSSTVFSDLAQEVHLFFFDINDKERFYNEDIHYKFTNRHGYSLDLKVSEIANKLFDFIIDIIFRGILDDEYEMLMQRPFQLLDVTFLHKESEEARKQIQCEVVLHVVKNIKLHLDNMSYESKHNNWDRFKFNKKASKKRHEEFWAQVRILTENELKNVPPSKNEKNDIQPSSRCLIM